MKRILLALVLICGSAHADRRGNRAAGITLTVLGAVHLVLAAVVGGVIFSLPSCDTGCSGGENDAATARAAGGIAGTAIAGIFGTSFLSVGIPMLALSSKPDATTVEATPSGLRVRF
jgi:hypothetical protein